jgi:hypothetical protein
LPLFLKKAVACALSGAASRRQAKKKTKKKKKRKQAAATQSEGKEATAQHTYSTQRACVFD